MDLYIPRNFYCFQVNSLSLSLQLTIENLSVLSVPPPSLLFLLFSNLLLPREKESTREEHPQLSVANLQHYLHTELPSSAALEEVSFPGEVPAVYLVFAFLLLVTLQKCYTINDLLSLS